MGFLKMVCICNPLNDKAIPTIKAVIAFGNRNLKIMVSKLLSLFVKKAFNTSEALMLTDPKNISSMRKPIRRNISIEKINFRCFPEVERFIASICISDFKQ
jgi:hypothetical protein